MKNSMLANVFRSIRIAPLVVCAALMGAVAPSQASAQTAPILCQQWGSGNVYVADESGTCHRGRRDVPLQGSPTSSPEEPDAPETESLDLLNGWMPYGGEHAGPTATRHGDLVILQGLVKAGQMGQPIATLPSDWAPEARLVFPSVSLFNRTRVDVLDDGSIVPVNGSSLWISLSGIVFTVADIEE